MHYAKDYGDIKALSMNLMHSHTGITDRIYAVLSNKDTHQRIRNLGRSGQSTYKADGLRKAEVIEELRNLVEQLENL
jgi:hypothetical protein